MMQINLEINVRKRREWGSVSRIPPPARIFFHPHQFSIFDWENQQEVSYTVLGTLLETLLRIQI